MKRDAIITNGPVTTVWQVTVARPVIYNDNGTCLETDLRDWGVYLSKRAACDAVLESYSGARKALADFLEEDSELFKVQLGTWTVEIVCVDIGEQLQGVA